MPDPVGIAPPNCEMNSGFKELFLKELIMSNVKISKTRGIKFLDLETSKLHKEIKVITRVCNDLVKRIKDDLKSGKLTKVTSYDFRDENGDKITFAKYRDMHIDVFKKAGWTKPMNGYERDIVGYVARRYKAFFKRNKTKKLPTMRIAEKGIHIKDRFVQIKEDHLLLPYHKQEKGMVPELKIPFSKCTNISMLSDLDIKKGVAGNVNLKQGFFMCTASIEVDPLYEFETQISFDINKDKNYWISFGDGEVLSMPNDIAEELESLRLLNEIVSNKNRHDSKMNSSQRGFFRRRWKNQHKKIEKMIEPYVMKIIDKAIETKALICIDNVTTGAANGSFGQDKITKLLQVKCENLRIPFYGVPTFYTSQKCSECGYCDPKNRDGENFNCKECDYSEVSHINAAKNIRNRALLFYKNGVPFGMYNNKEEQVIEKYGR
jgi:transposase